MLEDEKIDLEGQDLEGRTNSVETNVMPKKRVSKELVSIKDENVNGEWIGVDRAMSMQKLIPNVTYRVTGINYTRINGSDREYLYVNTTGGKLFETSFAKSWYTEKRPDKEIKCHGTFITEYLEALKDAEDTPGYNEANDALRSAPKNPSNQEIKELEKHKETYKAIRIETLRNKLLYKNICIEEMKREKASHWSLERFREKIDPTGTPTYRDTNIFKKISIVL